MTEPRVIRSISAADFASIADEFANKDRMIFEIHALRAERDALLGKRHPLDLATQQLAEARQECVDRAACEASLTDWNEQLTQRALAAEAERDALRKELAKFPTLDGALLIPCKMLAVQP